MPGSTALTGHQAANRLVIAADALFIRGVELMKYPHLPCRPATVKVHLVLVLLYDEVLHG